MAEIVRVLPCTGEQARDPAWLLGREWLVTNGLGGFAAGTLAGIPTRRYHALLVAALPTPLGRTVMLNHLSERVRFADGTRFEMGGHERAGGGLEGTGARYLVEFRLENGLPVWRYEVGSAAIEKRVRMPHQHNTVHVTYRLLRGEPARLELRPSLHVRPLEGSVRGTFEAPGTITAVEDRLDLATARGYPALRLRIYGPHGGFALDSRMLENVHYRAEAERGYADEGDLWSPGSFGADLGAGASTTLMASTESWDVIDALDPDEVEAAEAERREHLLAGVAPVARSGVGAELALAADQFVIRPSGRREDVARARAAGGDVRSIVAGYHWFTDWGRDTMISLEGLTCLTGRHAEAGYILRTFGQYVRDGLIPNMFPDGSNEGLYHTADATLWLFHAVDRYLDATGDAATLSALMPKLSDIVRSHLEGTRFGIHVDPKDGLLVQGADGYQLTWMDAKVDGWVVTPRRGKAVEINALWYNALRLLEGWTRRGGDEAAAVALAAHAEQCGRSFNARFWNPDAGYLYDVVESPDLAGQDDSACRPNQLLALSLTYPVLDQARWAPVVETARAKLLTPVGLRSLSPDHPEFKPSYHGDLRTRDAAYHQGTVWAWLIGPFIDAWLRVHPDDQAGARRFLDGFVPHLDDACIGSISEVFDAVPPYTPRGCVAQAWSVAEVLRAWVRTSAPLAAPAPP